MKKTIFLLLAIAVFNLISAQDKMNTKKWRKTEQDSMAHGQLFFEEGNKLLALPIFEKLLSTHPTENYLKYIAAVCGLERSDWHSRSLAYMQEIYAKNKKVHNIEFDLARAYHFNYKFDEAIAMLDQFELKNKKIEPDLKKRILLLRNYCQNGKKLFASPKPAKITNIGSPVNTEASEYVPVMNADESVMIYTYRGEKSTGGMQNAYNEAADAGIYYEDVFISTKRDNKWSDPQGIIPVNTRENDAAICLSHDGQTLFLFRDDRTNGGDIYVSHLQGAEWSSPDKLYGDVNSLAWDGSITLSTDEKTVIFSSERPGGIGGKDLYISKLQADGNWGQAKNLGDKINTPYDDDAPFLHPDGKTLIFSSQGFNSMGGYDIFRTILQPDSSWGLPENLGYPINTTDDDIYYVISADGKRGYYASGKEGGAGLHDIYLVEPGIEDYSPNLAMVKGLITLEKIPVSAEIEITDLTTGNKWKTEHSNADNGKYILVLPGGDEYNIRFKYSGHPDQVKVVSLLKQSGYAEQEINIDFGKKDTVIPVVTTPTVTTNTVVATNTTVSTNTVSANNTIPDVSNTMTKEGLIFKVQIAAYKTSSNYSYQHLSGLGQVEKMMLDDGITRFTIGGEFKTLEEANAYCSKVRKGGQPDAFVTAIYNGKRAYVEELENKGILPKRK